ncbi:MAG: SIMPL domain-containing protein [Candidatus Peribacteraceae bacterium]|nr:SIMPL domain-containing protein [Candidatus Peribacteraceae bacterium]
MEEQNLHIHPPVITLLVVTLLIGGFYLTGKYLEKQDLTPVMISVDADGKAAAIPDIAVVSFGVQTGRQSSAQQAMKILTGKMNDIIAVVKQQGIEDKDVSTASLSLYPAYDWDEGRQIPRGFEASQNLQVKVRDLDKIGAILSAVTTAGANQVGGVNFTIDDAETLKAMAREKAIQKAEAKAQQLATQLGMKIKKLKAFSEGGGYVPPMPYTKANVMMDSAGGRALEEMAVPVGEQEITVNVTMTYEME